MTFTNERTGQELTLGVSSDGRPSLEYMLSYLFRSDSATELTVAGVLSSLGLRAGSAFADDPNATLQRIRIARRLTRPPHCAWDVNIVFATNAKVPENDSQDPTQQRVKRYKRFSEQARQAIKDRNGTLIVNSATETFEDGVPVTDYPFSYIYEWNRSVPTRGFHGKINANTFNGCVAGTLLCLIQSEEIYEGSWVYWKETIEMRHNPLGWQPSPVNAGKKQRRWYGTYQDDEFYLTDCLDGNHQPTQVPQPLYDATADEGRGPGDPRLEGTMIPVANRPTDCVFVEVDHFETAQFEKIGVREFPE